MKWRLTETPYNSRLTDRGLGLDFFHHWRGNGLAFFDQFELPMFGETRSGRYQVAHDHVFLEAAQPIDFAERSRFGKNTCGILERSCRNEAVRFQRSLSDAEQHRNGLRRLAAFLHDFLVLFFEVKFIDLIAPKQRSVPGIGDLHL